MNSSVTENWVLDANGFFKWGDLWLTDVGIVWKLEDSHQPIKAEDVELCKDFIRRWCDRRKTICWNDFTAHRLKNAVETVYAYEHQTQARTIYVSEGSFIQAALELDYNARLTRTDTYGKCNVVFNISTKRLKKLQREAKLSFA